MGREFELKYAATPAVLAAIEASFENFETIAMQTTYYDTPDGALSARHMTLRRRLENGCSVCTLKTPTGTLSRGEWDTQSDSIEEAIPVLCKLSGWDLISVLESGVVATCGARFKRKASTVTLPGCTVEIALDVGILMGNNREMPLCEVEIELKSGSEEAAIVFADRLAKKYGLVQEYKSKFRRALALAKGENNGTF